MSKYVYHVRSASGQTLDWTPEYATAKAYARKTGAQLWRLDRETGNTVQLTVDNT